MTSRPTHVIAAITIAAAAGLAAAPSLAATLVGLADGKTLVIIDTDARKVTRTVPVTGAGPLVGIDVRPADGMLYGVTADGKVVTIDTQTGKATEKSTLKTMLPAGAHATVDFNPVADRLRIIGSDGTNLRANVDDGGVITDGALRYAATDANKDAKPAIRAGAYVNSFKGAKETTLYDIDGALGALARQAPPNDGVLNTLGALGVATTGGIGFDIESDGNGGNRAWLLAGGMLHSVDIASGKATVAARIDGLPANVTDIAFWPAK
ncbi:MAG: DUF4394 domain-containing protein [Rhodospirillales bacterium]|nr:DUF4394 domain-containing protein [Rhodospirillales bacterium]